MHPELVRFIEAFDREAALNGSCRSKLDRSALTFLEQAWGPAFDYNYDGLRAEHPFIEHKGGQRFADFVYVKNSMRLLIEIDGFTTHTRQISPSEFNYHLRLKPGEVAREFQISNRTAIDWLQRFEQEGLLKPHLSGQRVTSYSLANYK